MQNPSHNSSMSTSLNRTLLLMALLGLVGGCGSEDQKARGSGPGLPTGTELNPQAGAEWSETNYNGRWYQVKSRVLKNPSPESQRAQASALRLEEVDHKSDDSGYRAYRVIGTSSDQKNFVIPKVFLQSEMFGERTRLESDSHGNTTFQFSLALIDGQKTKLITGYSELPLPRELLGTQTSSKEGLKNLQSGTDCPDQIELTDGDLTLPVRVGFSEGGCPRNQFFPVIVNGPTDEVRSWLEERIPRGNVLIRAVFKPKVSILNEVVSIRMNGGLLFERLYAFLIEENRLDFRADISHQTWQAYDLHRLLWEFLNKIWKEVKFGGLSNAETHVILDSMIQNMFESVKDPSLVDFTPQLRLKYKSDLSSGALQFDFNRNESVSISGPPIEVTAPVHDLSHDTLTFKIESEKTDDLFIPIEGRSGGSLRQVATGDLVELEINEINNHLREYRQAMFNEEKSRLKNIVCTSYGEAPSVEVTDPGICLEYHQECKEWKTCNAWADPCVEWESSCSRWLSRGSDRSANLRTRVQGSYPSPWECTGERCVLTEHRCVAPTHDCIQWASTSCKRYGTKRIPSGPAPCNQEENQWMKHFDLADPLSMRVAKEDLSTLDATQIVGGLKLQFSSLNWNGKGEPVLLRVVCPVANFSPTVKLDGGKILIRFRIENRHENSCIPFNRQNTMHGFEPEVALMNQLAIPVQVPCGFREDFWNGKSVYTCPELNQSSDQIIFRTYYPRMDLTGRMRSPGVRFISSGS